LKKILLGYSEQRFPKTALKLTGDKILGGGKSHPHNYITTKNVPSSQFKGFFLEARLKNPLNDHPPRSMREKRGGIKILGRFPPR